MKYSTSSIISCWICDGFVPVDGCRQCRGTGKEVRIKNLDGVNAYRPATEREAAEARGDHG